MTRRTANALPPIVDQQTWQAALDNLRRREKAATRELDAIAAQRRRLPMVELPDYTLIGPNGPIRLVDVFQDRSQLIVYHHMWSDGAEWQCGGCTGLTSQWTRLGILDNYDARMVIVTNGPPIAEALPTRPRSATRWTGTRPRRARSAQTSTRRPAAASQSMCSCATATRSTAPGTPPDAEPNSSATHSP